MIEISNVSKAYGSVQALDRVSLKLEDGKIYGLLGRNGAGKTTLLNTVAGRLFADSGEITMDGEPIAENDAALVKIYMQSEAMLYPESMRVRDALEKTKGFYPNFDSNYANRLAEKFQLDPKKRIKSLSTGYASILKLIIALSIQVPYLFFDEPVLGLDANHRELFYRLLLENYMEHPATIVISTHLIEEVSGIIEDVVIINEGQIIRNQNREDLLAKGYTVSGPSAAVDDYSVGKEVIGSDTLGGLKSVHILGNPEEIPGNLEITALDLQKLFIQLTTGKGDQ